MAMIISDNLVNSTEEPLYDAKDVNVNGQTLTTVLDSLKGQRQIVQAKSEMTVDGVVYMLPHVASGTTTIDYYEIYQKKTGVAQPVLIGKEEYSGYLSGDNLSTSNSTAQVGYVKKDSNGKLVVDLTKVAASSSSSVTIEENTTDKTIAISNGNTSVDNIATTEFVNATVGYVGAAATAASNAATLAQQAASEAAASVNGAKVVSGTSMSGDNLVINYANGTSDSYKVKGDNGKTYTPQLNLVSGNSTNQLPAGQYMKFVNLDNPDNDYKYVKVSDIVGIDGKTYVPDATTTTSNGKIYLTFSAEGRQPINVDVTSLKGVQGDKGDDGAYYIPYESLVTHDNKLCIRFDKSDSATEKQYIDASQLKGDSGNNAHVKLIQSTSNGYSHVYVKAWEGDSEPADSSTNKSADLMAQVNDVLEAVEKILDGDLTVDVTE